MMMIKIRMKKMIMMIINKNPKKMQIINLMKFNNKNKQFNNKNKNNNK